MAPSRSGDRSHIGRRVRQVLWFVVLWAGGVAAVSVVAYGIRWWLSTA